MAEFQVVAKEIERLCTTYQDKCRTDKCPLYLEDLCYAQAMRYIHKYEADKLEDTVMEWAAEHPEPKYPTWWKYMRMIGVIPDTFGDKTLGEMTVYSLMNTHIQSDIAQKLGIEPKEG